MCLLNICTLRYYKYLSFYISKLILFSPLQPKSFLISVVYFTVNEPIASAFWLSQSPRVFLNSLSCRILFSTNCWLDREGYGNPLQYACLENPVDRGAWWAAIHGVTELDMTWGDLACMHALEKEMATHASVLAWRIPGTEESGGLLSMGSHRVRHDWSDLAAAAVGWAFLYAFFM